MLALYFRASTKRIEKKMAPQAGLEPATYCLEGSCSVQLSYWGANTVVYIMFF